MPTPDQIVAVLDQLTRGPAMVRQVIYEVAPALRKRRPAPRVWSAHEHAVHLPAIYPLVVRRLEQMLTETAPHIKSYEPSRDDPDDALLKLDLDVEMDRFDRERAELIARLRTLTPDEWAITATHDEYSHYGVFIMFRHIALHDLHHAYKIEERLLRKEWPNRPAPQLWSTEVETFLELVVKSGLLTTVELFRACGGCDADPKASSALHILCEYLVSKELLTRWQCDKLRVGKWKGFFLDGYCMLSQIGKDMTSSTYLCKEVATGKRVAMRVTPPTLAPQDGRIHYEVTELPEEAASHEV